MKKFKMAIAIILALSAVLTLAACSSGTTTANPPAGGTTATNPPANPPAGGASTQTAAPPQKGLKIGIAIHGWTTNPIFIDMGNVLRARAKEEGHTLNEFPLLAAEDIPRACESFISAGCDIVIIQGLYADAVKAQMQPMIDAGITVSVYDNVFDNAIYNASCDNYDTGYAVGKAAAEWANEHISGEVFAGTLSRSTIEVFKIRSQGITDGLNENLKNGKEVISQEASGVDGSLKALENMVQAYPRLNLVCAWNGSAGVGAYEGLKTVGLNDRDDVALFGCDASQDELTCILENKTFKATAELDLANQIGQLYDKSIAYVRNGKEYPAGTTDTDKTWYFPVTIVYSDTAANYLLKK